MRGTQRVGSLLRLFLSAAFLCLAWVLLSSTQADAAERPAPIDLIATASAPVAESAAAAHAPVLEESVAVLSGRAAPIVAPVVEQLRTTTAASVDGGATGLKTLAAAVPLLEAPVVAVADDVVALADAVPVVGRNPVVDVPLSGRPSTPVPVQLPEVDVLVPTEVSDQPAKSVAEQHDSRSSVTEVAAPRGLVLAALDSDLRRVGAPSVHVNEQTPLRSDAPEPSGLPEPWPAPQSPMSPTQSVPSPGGGASSGDLASMGPAVVLPSPTTRGSSSADWRVPRGLPDRPGSRPD